MVPSHNHWLNFAHTSGTGHGNCSQHLHVCKLHVISYARAKYVQKHVCKILHKQLRARWVYSRKFFSLTCTLSLRKFACIVLYIFYAVFRACISLVISRLLKVASCRRKLPPIWLVSASYSAWHFFTDGVF